MEQLKEKVGHQHSPDDKPETQDEYTPSSAMTSVVAKNNTYEHLAKLKGVRDQLSHSIASVQGEVRIDRNMITMGLSNDMGRNMMLENAEVTVYKKKGEMIGELQQRITATDKKINELMDSIHHTPKENPAVGTTVPADDAESADRNKSKPADENPNGKAAAASREQPKTKEASANIDIRV